MQSWLALPARISVRFGLGKSSLTRAQRALLDWGKVDDYQAVLDLSCDNPELLLRIKQYHHVRACGVVGNTAFSNQHDDELELLKARLTDLPWRDNSFDTVFSSKLLSLNYLLYQATGEIIRVLKPGGQLIACMPGFPLPSLRQLKRSGVDEQHRKDSPYLFMQQLENGGFEDVTMRCSRLGYLTIIAHKAGNA